MKNTINNCFICKKTNHHFDSQVVVIATFSQKFHGKDALSDIEKAHIMPIWLQFFSKEEIAKKNNREFLESDTLILQLHGIKDIVRLEALYVESICRNNNALTCDIVSAQNQCEKLIQQLQ